jgi:LysR family transcriptional regulator (chromosome initiation inhibitor)
MLDYAALSALAAVVREGSFDAAAAALNITPSAVSQRIKGLEERLGAVLVVRSQPCTATPTGAVLCSHVDRVRLLEADLSLPGLSQGPPTLRVAVNADSLATWFPGAAAAFAADGAATLDLMLDDEGHTAARLRSGEVLAAVTADPAPVTGCRISALGTMTYCAVATPDFIARHFGKGTDPAAALAEAPMLRFDRRDQMQARWARAAHGVEIAPPMHWAPSTQGMLDLTLAGMGWSLAPLRLLSSHLTAGRLAELPPERRMPVALYWQSARLHAAALDRLTEAVTAAARKALED